jgi:hypothetical protein
MGRVMAAHTEARLGHVPHFEVTTLDGHRVRYQEIWQRRALVLVVVTASEREAAAHYASLLKARQSEFEDAEATVVVTAEAVPGLSPRRVVVADRWGEILHSASPPAGEFPAVDELLSWVRFARIQCPECPP